MPVTVITPAMRNAAFNATAAAAEPLDDEPFQVGEAVVYLAHGVGRIDSIGEEEIGGHRLRIIQVSFPESSMILRLPAGKARAAGLRRVATTQVLDAAVKLLGQAPRSSKMAWAKRSQEYLARINSGDVATLASVVRDLQASANGAGTSVSQRTLFELAIGRLAAEVAVATGIDKTEALTRLNAALHKPREAAA